MYDKICISFSNDEWHVRYEGKNGIDRKLYIIVIPLF